MINKMKCSTWFAICLVMFTVQFLKYINKSALPIWSVSVMPVLSDPTIKTAWYKFKRIVGI